MPFNLARWHIQRAFFFGTKKAWPPNKPCGMLPPQNFSSAREQTSNVGIVTERSGRSPPHHRGRYAFLAVPVLSPSPPTHLRTMGGPISPGFV
jgi:hypothetical protein